MISIQEAPLSNLAEYATISIAFEVSRRFEVIAFGDRPKQHELVERPVQTPWLKDYDAIAGNSPTRWLNMFDLTNWGMLFARMDGWLVGGAVIAYRTKGLDVLHGRDDLAVLWDIRVAPEQRGQGIGKVLFAAVEDWARRRQCVELQIETQDVNVGACKFYQRQGCELIEVNRGAYPMFPEEVQLVWGKGMG